MNLFLIFWFYAQEVVGSASSETNLALGKPASQSSTFFGSMGQASNAVDGNVDGNFYAGSCSHTIKNVGTHWWMVDLEGIYTVRSFRITNRVDCCSRSLSHLVIEVSTESPSQLAGFPQRTNAATCKNVVGVVPYGIPFPFECDAPVSGRYVRIIITNSLIYKSLTFCEFEVYENNVAAREVRPESPNLALKKPASQSSTFIKNDNSGYPDHANDGDDFDITDWVGCSMTDEDILHWWMVDLEDVYTIGTIRITNSFECCSESLSDFVIEVSEKEPSALEGFPGRTDTSVCVTVIEPVPIPFPVNYDCDQPVTGRYVRIVKGGKPLVLCELAVYEVDPFRKRVPGPLQPTQNVEPSQTVENIQKKQLTKKTEKAGRGMLVFVHITSHGFQHTHTSMSEQRYLTDCARQRLKDKTNRMAAPYIQIDLPDGMCRFLENIADVKNSTSSKWTVYELVYL